MWVSPLSTGRRAVRSRCGWTPNDQTCRPRVAAGRTHGDPGDSRRMRTRSWTSSAISRKSLATPDHLIFDGTNPGLFDGRTKRLHRGGTPQCLHFGSLVPPPASRGNSVPQPGQVSAHHAAGSRPSPYCCQIGVTQLVAECTESGPIAPEYGQDGTCEARPISSIFCTKTVQLRDSYQKRIFQK